MLQLSTYPNVAKLSICVFIFTANLKIDNNCNKCTVQFFFGMKNLSLSLKTICYIIHYLKIMLYLVYKAKLRTVSGTTSPQIATYIPAKKPP